MTNSEWLTCRVEATRGDKRHVSQAADPGVIVASKSIDDDVIVQRTMTLTFSLVCRRIRGYRIDDDDDDKEMKEMEFLGNVISPRIVAQIVVQFQF